MMNICKLNYWFVYLVWMNSSFFWVESCIVRQFCFTKKTNDCLGIAFYGGVDLCYGTDWVLL